jgi:putative DNA primase/helicase
MDLINYCRAHGIIVATLPPLGVWRRYPTVDHPHKRNGAVKWLGEIAFVQNHATDQEVSVWKSEGADKIDRAKFVQIIKSGADEIQQKQKDAAARAAWILHQCSSERHKYFFSRGFPEEQGNVWRKDDKSLLVIPMRIDGRVVGCQLIDEDGNKKFLSGQRTSDASFIIDNKGTNVLCEGFATALSIQQAMRSLRRRYKIHVCFSAGNMLKIANALDGGVVVADNDASGTGERIAREIGWPYWMSKTVGNDANDDHKAMGLFRFSQSLAKAFGPTPI